MLGGSHIFFVGECVITIVYSQLQWLFCINIYYLLMYFFIYLLCEEEFIVHTVIYQYHH